MQPGFHHLAAPVRSCNCQIQYVIYDKINDVSILQLNFHTLCYLFIGNLSEDNDEYQTSIDLNLEPAVRFYNNKSESYGKPFYIQSRTVYILYHSDPPPPGQPSGPLAVTLRGYLLTRSNTSRDRETTVSDSQALTAQGSRVICLIIGGTQVAVL